MVPNKTCKECGEPIKGRADKKFCSDHCRNAYHNKFDVQNKNLIRNINNRLKKNYRILSGLKFKEGKARVSKIQLMDKGFHFEYITNLYTTQKGTVYYFIYDLGYLPLDNDLYMVVRRA
jgi:predicted nucleic acid-binding Zn ribbon protein